MNHSLSSSPPAAATLLGRLAPRPFLPALFDRGRREFAACAVAAVLLVLLRSAIFALGEEVYFNSDQAILGLMAKHLSEFRGFPLFFYGQNYMLGVQAWIVAPFFWVLRPSVFAFRLPLVLLNAAAAVVFVRVLYREVGLRPLLAFVAMLPFILPSPIAAASMIDGNGCGAGELFLYVAAFWALRRRPLAFGVLLAIGYLHREFTLAVLPGLAVVALFDRSTWTTAAVRNVLRGAVGFTIAWVVIDDLRLHFYGASLALQVEQLGGHLCFRAAELPARLRYVVTDCLPALLGGRRLSLPPLGIGVAARAGSAVVGFVLLAGLAAMALRLPWTWRRTTRESSFPVYLLVAGLAGLFSYSLACNANVRADPIFRYLHLAFFIPIAIFAAFVRREPRAAWRRAAVAVFLVAAGANLVDTVVAARAAYARPLPTPHRQLADLLVQHRVKYARAGYWDAYVVDFFTREKVIVGTTGKVRIPEYEAAVDAHPDTAATIQRYPCDGGIRQAPWCIAFPSPAPPR